MDEARGAAHVDGPGGGGLEGVGGGLEGVGDLEGGRGLEGGCGPEGGCRTALLENPVGRTDSEGAPEEGHGAYGAHYAETRSYLWLLDAGPAGTYADRLSLLSDDDLSVAITEVSEQIERLSALRLELASAYERREAYRPDGSLRMDSWLAERVGVSSREASAISKIGARLGELPETAKALAEGRLTLDKVRALIRVATPRNEAELVDLAEGQTVAGCEELARRLRRVRPAEAKARQDAAYVQMFFNDEGMLRILGQLADEDGQVLMNVLYEMASKEPPDAETGQFAPIEQRLARALAELASMRLAALGDGHRAQVVLHIDPEALAGEGGEGVLGDGVGLSRDAVQRVLCDCRFQVVTENDRGEPIGLGRSARTASPVQNREIRRRDGGCRFPGCVRTRWTNSHHIKWWTRGGRTNPDNLVTLCVAHHHLVHEGGWVIGGDAWGLMTFTSPRGKILTSRPARFPASVLRRLRPEWDPPNVVPDRC